MTRPAPAIGHQTASPDACPECNLATGWQNNNGFPYFVQLVRHESDLEDDLMLADAIEYVITKHLPGDDGLCAECGERWFTPDDSPNTNGIQCQAWIDMRFARCDYIQKRLDEIKARWSM